MTRSVKGKTIVDFPELVAEWHPSKNGDLRPDQVAAGANKKFWWRCPAGPDHEWQATAGKRTAGRGCPFCRGLRASVTNSIASQRPDLVAKWHPSKNGDLRPDQVPVGSHLKVWWKCASGADHEWQATVDKRTRSGQGCPFCASKKVSVTNSLAALEPDLAAQWHPTKNNELRPEAITSRTTRRVWWQCGSEARHEWQASVASRTAGCGCPFCANQRTSATNNLAVVNPELAREWHPTKNRGTTPDQVVAGSGRKFWWKCPVGEDHEWRASVVNRARGAGCPFCANQRLSSTNNLAFLRPDLARDWHPTKNGDSTPRSVGAGSARKAWWKCDKGPDHEWQATIDSRARGGNGCPFCTGRRASVTNNLESSLPTLAAEWHPTKNGDLTARQVTAHSNRQVWWRCGRNPQHEWQASIAERSGKGLGCPICRGYWKLPSIRAFVASLLDHLPTFTPAELYLVFQQSGVLGDDRKSTGFVKALVTGRFPPDEVEKWTRGEPSLVDRFIDDPTLTLEGVDADAKDGRSAESPCGLPVDEGDDDAAEDEADLPTVRAREALAALDSHVVALADAEAVAFLLASAKAKLWAHAFVDENEAVAQTAGFQGGDYAKQVRDAFLGEYRSARELLIPAGYSFCQGGCVIEPNLMQRLVAVHVRDRMRVGNWSGTGAGKTLSAVLASRVVDAQLTVVCCPNPTVGAWATEIRRVFPDSVVATKTWEPAWAGASGRPRYLVMNYEQFQQDDSEGRVKAFLAGEGVDFVVVDEIHYAKQRFAEHMSRRKSLVMALIAAANDRNPELRVLGLSATPVINNLQEGRSLVELVTGLARLCGPIEHVGKKAKNDGQLASGPRARVSMTGRGRGAGR